MRGPRSRSLPTLPEAERVLLRHGRAGARACPLQLAAATRPGACPPAAPRPRRLEPGPLHARDRRQGLRRGLQRRPPEPAQLRWHRAPLARPLPLGPDARPPVPAASPGREGGRPRGGRGGVLARREPHAEARRGSRRRRARTTEGRVRRVTDHGSGALRRRARAPVESPVPVQLHAEPARAPAAQGRALPRALRPRQARRASGRCEASTTRTRRR